MLVLTRKRGEKIRINDDITLVVVELRGDKVRIGIDAPESVRVHREEVYRAIKRKEADRNAAYNALGATDRGENGLYGGPDA